MEMSKSRRRMNEIIRYGLLIGVGIILIYPLFWMIGSAFKENRDIYNEFFRCLAVDARPFYLVFLWEYTEIFDSKNDFYSFILRDYRLCDCTKIV